MKRSKQSELVDQARKLGFKVEMTKGSHYKVLTPMGPCYMPSTPSETTHGWKRDRNRLQKMGVPVV